MACNKEEETPFLAPQNKPSSVFKTFGNILISIVGAGVLGLPYTFKKTGWLSGLIILAAVGLTAYYGMMLLVWTKRAIEERSEGSETIDSFGSLGFAVYGIAGKAMVDLMVVLCMVAVCVGYLIFIGNTFSSMFFHFHGIQMSLGALKVVFVGLTFPLEVLMSAIESLTHLAPFSIFADAVNISAMVTVVLEEVDSIVKAPGPNVRAFGGWSAVPYGVGVAIYAFEGVSIILPLELTMEKRHRFGWALGFAFIFIVCIYGGFGAFGYVAFGDKTDDIVTLNLGSSWVTTFVQIALCLNLFFTFPLMLNPVYEVLERRLSRGHYSFILRSLVVLLTAVVALLVPSFADFLSLIGSSIGCVLGFVLPALFHLHTCWNQCSRLWIVADALLLAFGIVFGIFGTVSSITELCFN